MTTNIHATLLERHQAMQAQLASQPDALPAETILHFLEEARTAGASIADVRQREQLRAILRHWGGILFDRLGDYPAIQLAPYEGKPILESTDDGRVAGPLPERWSPLATGIIIALILFLLAWLVIAFLGRLAGAAASSAAELTRAHEASISVTGSSDPTETPPPTATSEVTEEAMGEESEDTVTATPQTAVAHLVQSGETLEVIARRYGVAVNQIVVLNQLTADTIAVGQQLFIPINTQFVVLELVVKATTAALHSAPDLDSRPLAALERGTFATISGQTADFGWYQVAVADSRSLQGWLAAADVRLLYPTRPEIIPLVTPTP